MIDNNELVGHRNWAESYMKSFAYDIYRYMPTNYFKYSQAPLMKIDYPYNVYAGLQFLIESSLDQF